LLITSLSPLIFTVSSFSLFQLIFSIDAARLRLRYCRRSSLLTFLQVFDDLSYFAAPSPIRRHETFAAEVRVIFFAITPASAARQ